MINKKLEFVFIGMIIVSILILTTNYYSKKSFRDNPLSDEYKNLITQKEQEILTNMQKYYGFKFKIPLIITDKFKGRLYGAAVYKNGDVKIYLNKNVMRESMDYMINSVMAHEYAHAIMLKRGMNTSTNAGHSDEWKQICVKLGGLNCEKYVDRNEVVMGKMPF